MKSHSTSGKRCLARRLVMPDANRDKDDFQDGAVSLTNRESQANQDQYSLNSRLCFNDNSNDEEPVYSASPQRNLHLARSTSFQDNRIQRILLSTQPSDGFFCLPVETSESPNSLVYAGAKFNESPSPKVLPKPPLHWVGSPNVVDCGAIECVLKVMLRVQC